MDWLDTKLFQELFQSQDASPLPSDFRASFRSMARRLGVEEATLRNRIKSFQQSGVLNGWRVFVNPTLLGYGVAEIWLDVSPPSSKREMIRKIRLIQGVSDVVSHVGSSLTSILLYPGENSLRKQTELAARITNCENVVVARIPFPSCMIKLAPMDWRIIRSLKDNPRKQYSLLSEQLGLSNKTVKRRIRRLIDGKAVFFLPSLDPTALRGVIIADLLVFYETPGSKHRVDTAIRSRLQKHLLRAEIGDKDHGFYNLAISNVAMAEEIQSWVGELPGVSNVRVDLVQERFESSDIMDDLLQNRETGAPETERSGIVFGR